MISSLVSLNTFDGGGSAEPARRHTSSHTSISSAITTSGGITRTAVSRRMWSPARRPARIFSVAVGLNLAPNVNLITNIAFVDSQGPDANDSNPGQQHRHRYRPHLPPQRLGPGRHQNDQLHRCNARLYDHLDPERHQFRQRTGHQHCPQLDPAGRNYLFVPATQLRRLDLHRLLLHRQPRDPPRRYLDLPNSPFR